MKVYFENADALRAGIALVAEDLDITLCDKESADLTVSVTESDERIVEVVLDGKAASITFGDGKARFFRALAQLVYAVRNGETSKTITERPLFKTNGTMADMSRNPVMNVQTVKAMLRRMALMGLNTYMLYTEDTYELGDHPYFGYMRGRYTKAELKELDAYGITLGIELIPCIQTLGHLSTHLRWAAAGAYRDTERVMLVGADETYALIEDMLTTVSECFTTRRIHVGMDETHDIGTGAYLKKYGYKDGTDIYLEHLAKVIKMCEAHGLKPMMWSDMFFRLAGRKLPKYADYMLEVEFDEELIEKIKEHTKGIQQVFWDYYRSFEEFYTGNLEKHEMLFGDNVLFAGGVWTWSGHCPLYTRSIKNTVPALDACRKKGVQEIFATMWNNGSEGTLILGMLGLAWYADYDYKGRFDEESAKECFAFSCGADYDEIKLCERPETLVVINEKPVSVTRTMLYNDPLVGLIDKHIEGLDTQSHFAAVTEELESAKSDKGLFAPAFEIVRAISALLVHKADFGVRLTAAYKAGDKETLATMLAECDVIQARLADLREAHRKSWFTYNKPFGWEEHDLRYGGLAARFDTVKRRLAAYLDGEICRIEELEEERLRYDGDTEDAPKIDQRFLWMGYNTIAKIGI